MKKLLLTTALVMSSTAAFAHDVPTDYGLFDRDCNAVVMNQDGMHPDSMISDAIVASCAVILDAEADAAADAQAAADQAAAEAAAAEALAAAIADAQAALPGLAMEMASAVHAATSARVAFEAAEEVYNYENGLYQADQAAFYAAVANGGPSSDHIQTTIDLANAYINANGGNCTGHGGAGSDSLAAAIEFRAHTGVAWYPGAPTICQDRDVAMENLAVVDNSLEDWAQGISQYATDVEVLRVAMEDARDAMNDAVDARSDAIAAYQNAYNLVNG